MNLKCECLIMQLRQGSILLRIKLNFLTKMVIEEIRMYFLSISNQLEKTQLIHNIESMRNSKFKYFTRYGTYGLLAVSRSVSLTFRLLALHAKLIRLYIRMHS